MPVNPVRFTRKVAYFATFALAAPLLLADSFDQTNLVSNVPSLAANTDPNLRNPWGVSFAPTSPFWVSDQASGLSTLYDPAGVPQSLVVTIPGSVTPPSGPTGQVFNSTLTTTTPGFALPNGSPAVFIFDTLNGTIDGWNGGTSAVQAASTPGAIYTGLALASSGGSNYLYGADSTGQIRVFDSTFHPATLAGNFTDPHPITGYAPFNIQTVGGQLYVTYAQLTPLGVAAPGSAGYIDIFNTDGTFVKRFATGGPLFAPWGLSMSPSGFGSFGNDLLVGNFGNGEILAYSPSGTFLGTLDGTNGKPLTNDFLWALEFRHASGFNPDALFFTAGINNQTDGLFGDITPTPEPAAFLFTAIGLGVLLLFGRLRTSSQAGSPSSK